MIKDDTHIVIKREWLNVLTNEALESFYENLEVIYLLNGKHDHKYYVCNTDEPYAQEVLDVILKHENQKGE